MTYQFFIARRAPSLNEHVQNAGPSRWRYAKERDMWLAEVRAARVNNRIPKAAGKRALVVTRRYSGREKERDYVNLVGGMKVIVDALVLEGLLVDDKPAYLADSYVQIKCDKTEPCPSGVRFEISDVAS